MMRGELKTIFIIADPTQLSKNWDSLDASAPNPNDCIVMIYMSYSALNSNKALSVTWQYLESSRTIKHIPIDLLIVKEWL